MPGGNIFSQLRPLLLLSDCGWRVENRARRSRLCFALWQCFFRSWDFSIFLILCPARRRCVSSPYSARIIFNILPTPPSSLSSRPGSDGFGRESKQGFVRFSPSVLRRCYCCSEASLGRKVAITVTPRIVF